MKQAVIAALLGAGLLGSIESAPPISGGYFNGGKRNRKQPEFDPNKHVMWFCPYKGLTIIRNRKKLLRNC